MQATKTLITSLMIFSMHFPAPIAMITMTRDLGKSAMISLLPTSSPSPGVTRKTHRWSAFTRFVAVPKSHQRQEYNLTMTSRSVNAQSG